MGNWLEPLQDRNHTGFQTGTSQVGRVLNALNPTHAGIEESTDASFVQFLFRYSKLIAFYDTDNRFTGSWKEMLGRSALLSLLDRQSFDPKMVSESFHIGVEQLKNDHHKGKAIAILTSAPYRLVVGIFAEIEILKLSTRRIVSFNTELIKLIRQNLAAIFKRLRDYTVAFQLTGALVPPDLVGVLQNTVEDWINEDIEKQASAFTDVGSDPFKDLGDLTIMFTELMQLVSLIRESAAQNVRKDLIGGEVRPQIALLLGFFEMMKVAYGELNRFGSRHLDYYFQEVLKIKLKAESPDQAHVVFALAENVDAHVLEAGTELLAGQDSNGQDRIYRLDRYIALNKARLTALKAIIHDPWSPSPPFVPAAGQPVETFIINTLPPQELVTERILATAKGETFFRPGFAIATAIWHVESSTALLKMTIACEPVAFRQFTKLLAARWNAMINAPADETVEVAEKNRLIEHLFSVEYSIEGGLWHRLPDARVELSLRTPTEENLNPFLDLNLLLQHGDPQIMPCTAPEFAGAVALGIPVFRFVVSEDHLYLYELFSKLATQHITLYANVLDVRSLILQNDFGLLDPNVPFLPFGPMPALGANFYIGHARLFDYPIHALKINIEWYQLPTEKYGFADYYADYGFEGNNHSFKALLSILHQKNWIPRDQKQLVSLFQSVSLENGGRIEPKDRLSKIRRVNEIDLERIKLPAATKHQPIVALEKETLRGFLRLQLAEPVVAFGHQMYPEILTRKITEAIRKKKPVVNPNQPYTPTIKSISLDYSTSVTCSLKPGADTHRETIYHMHPFGVVELKAATPGQPLTLLPQYARGAHLYMGIEDLQPHQPISILFQVSDNGALDYKEPPELHWSYLSGGQWVPMRPEERIFDTTEGLIKSGVIGFKFINEIIPDHTLLPSNLTWISCVTSTGTPFLSNLIDIKLHGTICTFKNEHNTLEHLENGLEGNSITGLRQPDRAVATVLQPYRSFGGRNAEDISGYYNRVSELLRHKDRAISIWDYENLILETFQDIRKTICLSHLNRAGGCAPGHLLIIVMPRMKTTDRALGQPSRVSAGRLAQIKRFLEPRCSQFVQLHVTNPRPEKIMVSAGVKLKPGYDDYNFYINKLNQSLKRMISPWFYDDDFSAGIAAKLHTSSVIEFIDNQPYVDFVSNFKLSHIVDEVIVNAKTQMGEYEIIDAQRPDGILLSVEQHQLTVITEEVQDEAGIGSMVAQVNLTVPVPEDVVAGIETVLVEKDLQIAHADAPIKRRFHIKFQAPKS